jgi:hypothetical protein
VRSPQNLAKLLSHTNAASAACKWEEASKHMNAVDSWYDASHNRESARDGNCSRVVTHHTVLEQQVKALIATTHVNFSCFDDANMAESKGGPFPPGRRCKPPKRPECSNSRPDATDSLSGTTDSISAGARKPFENDRHSGATTARANSDGGGGGGEPILPPIPSGTHNPKVALIFNFLQHVCVCVYVCSSQHCECNEWNDVAHCESHLNDVCCSL